MSDIESIFNERELKVLREAMAEKDMSAAAVVRHFFRMGQLCDFHLKQGHTVLFKDKDTGEIIDPFDHGPKKAPMPNNVITMPAPIKQLSCGCDVGVCICDYEKD